MARDEAKAKARQKKYRENLKTNDPAKYEERKQRHLNSQDAAYALGKELRDIDREFNQVYSRNNQLWNMVPTTQQPMIEEVAKFYSSGKKFAQSEMDWANEAVDRLHQTGIEGIENVSALNLYNLRKQWHNESVSVEQAKAKWLPRPTDDDDRKPAAVLTPVASEAITTEQSNVVIHVAVATKATAAAAEATAPEASTAKAVTNLGDPRMNKAVHAYVSNPALSLGEALEKGGYKFPVTTKKFHGLDKRLPDRDIKDEDGKTMEYLKHLLDKRIRRFKRNQPKAAKRSAVPKLSIAMPGTTMPELSTATDLEHSVSQPQVKRKRDDNRGDPRMNKALQAMLANPKLSKEDALEKGGFKFPVTTKKLSDKNNKDEDGVSMMRRKGNLGKRLKKAKSQQQQAENRSAIPMPEQSTVIDPQKPIEEDTNNEATSAGNVTNFAEV